MTRKQSRENVLCTVAVVQSVSGGLFCQIIFNLSGSLTDILKETPFTALDALNYQISLK